MYLESLEEYTVWLEDQIRTVGLVPASMERVSTFQELKARTVRVRLTVRMTGAIISLIHGCAIYCAVTDGDFPPRGSIAQSTFA